jgi:hypothetical protein
VEGPLFNLANVPPKIESRKGLRFERLPVRHIAGIPMGPGMKQDIAEDALEWLRNNNPDPDGIDGPTLRALSNLAAIPLPHGKPEDKPKKKALDDAVEWLRSSDVTPDDLDEPMIQTLANVVGIPMPREQIPPTRRNRSPKTRLSGSVLMPRPSRFGWTHHAMRALSNLADIPLPKGRLGPSAKNKAVDDAVEWIRKNVKPADLGDPTTQALAKEEEGGRRRPRLAS